MPADAMGECLILDWLTLDLNLTLHLAARIKRRVDGDDGARMVSSDSLQRQPLFLGCDHRCVMETPGPVEDFHYCRESSNPWNQRE